MVRIAASQHGKKSGASYSSWPISVPGKTLEPFGIATFSDASSAIVGQQRGGKEGPNGWIGRVSHEGKLLHGTAISSGDSSSIFHEVAVTSADTAIAVGTSTANSLARRHWIVAVDIAGKVLWQRKPEAHDGVSLVSVAAEPGGFIVSGNVGVAGVPAVFAGRFSNMGASLWQRVYGLDVLGAPSWATRGVLLGAKDGGMFVGVGFDNPATITSGVAEKPLVLRTGPWGEISCLDAGACKTKELSDCDDGDPCTADLCVPNKGCAHAPIAGSG